jgi:hypothetical protein
MQQIENQLQEAALIRTALDNVLNIMRNNPEGLDIRGVLSLELAQVWK